MRRGAECIAIAVVGCFLSASCYSTTKYRVGIVDDPESARTVACLLECERQHLDSRGDCMAECPGIEVEDGGCGPQDQAPRAFCREHRTDETRDNILYGILLVLGLAALVGLAIVGVK